MGSLLRSQEQDRTPRIVVVGSAVRRSPSDSLYRTLLGPVSLLRMGKKSALGGAAVLLLPILEVVALVVVGNALGFLRTIALFVLLSVVGAWIFKIRLTMLATSSVGGQGQNLAEVPKAVGVAVLAVLGGALIMLPGFITAIAGALLQFGPVRAALAHRVSGKFTTSVGSVGGFFGASADSFQGRGDVIDTDLATNDRPASPQSSPELS